MRSKVIGVFVYKEIQDYAVPVQGIIFVPGEVEYAPANLTELWVQNLRLEHNGGDYRGPW